MDSISIKRSITVRAVVTPSWKEEAERELSNAISAIDQQLGELEKEGQQIVEQGQIDSYCDLKIGDNLVSKMGVSILVRDGIVEAIDQA